MLTKFAITGYPTIIQLILESTAKHRTALPRFSYKLYHLLDYGILFSFPLIFLRLAVPVFITNLPPPGAGPPHHPPPPPRVNIYFTQLQLSALLRRTGDWGGGTTRLPGVVHILGLLGVGHTSINGKTSLRNPCFRNILSVNTSQSVPNP